MAQMAQMAQTAQMAHGSRLTTSFVIYFLPRVSATIVALSNGCIISLDPTTRNRYFSSRFVKANTIFHTNAISSPLELSQP